MRGLKTSATGLALALCACASVPSSTPADVASALTQARAADGRWISWAEHRIDDEGLSGVPLRGADGLKLADLDRDGHEDIVAAHEDSRHVRIAFGSGDPHRWTLVTAAEGAEADTAEDIALADLNGDGWTDILVACEQGHLLYLQNPGPGARTTPWPRLIPPVTQGRGSWIRVFTGDFDGDGRLEVAAANKGVVNTAGSLTPQPISIFRIAGAPLDGSAWKETVVARVQVPLNAMPVDLEGDGDLDLLIGSRTEGVSLAENRRAQGEGPLSFRVRTVVFWPGRDPGRPDWKGLASGFHIALSDVDGDGRTDLALGYDDVWTGGKEGPSYGWARQPADLAAPWIIHRIGDVLPDSPLSFAFADIDGDGDGDGIGGSYSGLHVFKGGLTSAPRDRDGPEVTAGDTVGRIAWHQRGSDPGQRWTRHDVLRRVRGMYDEFIPRDMDRDGDIDFVLTRGNSGALDGVLWLEQVRTRRPVPALKAAHPEESRGLPLPPPDWRSRYPQ